VRLPFIALGAGYFMVIGSDHKLYSWGRNQNFQLWNGSTSAVSIPTALPALKHVISVSSGGYHCMVLCSNSQLFSWGYNNCGQVGNGFISKVRVSTPFSITLPGNISCISCGC
jgi:alpha-tubulin suppressor-like RCC1 family protein